MERHFKEYDHKNLINMGNSLEKQINKIKNNFFVL